MESWVKNGVVGGNVVPKEWFEERHGKCPKKNTMRTCDRDGTWSGFGADKKLALLYNMRHNLSESISRAQLSIGNSG